MEVYRITLDGQAHTIPWHVVKAADKASFDTASGVVVLRRGEDWMSVSPLDANRPGDAEAPKFHVRDGKMFDAAGKRISGVRT